MYLRKPSEMGLGHNQEYFSPQKAQAFRTEPEVPQHIQETNFIVLQGV